MTSDAVEYKNLAHKAHEFAERCHAETNHLYDGHPYTHHLVLVVGVAEKNISNFPEFDRDVIIAACWAHDTIEDTRQTYNDVKKVLGEKVADIVYACTTEKGKTRKERQSDKYYEGIRNTPGATFVKLCDRIANTMFSKATKSGMFEKYKGESEEFLKKIGATDGNYKAMIDILIDLYKD